MDRKVFWDGFQKFANPCDKMNGLLVDVKRFVTKLGHTSSNLEKLKKSKIRIKIKIKIRIRIRSKKVW